MNSDERPPRLKRLDRLFTSHPLYFVTTNTDDRKPILASAKVHEDFRKFCGAGLTRSVFVGKYVLMPDHLHLFVAFGEEYESALIKRRQSQTDATEDSDGAAVCDRRLSLLSEWMKSLKNSLSKTLRGMNVPAPHWQKGFFDHVMRSEESYSEKWLYVPKILCGRNWQLVLRIGRIKEKFIHCKQEDTFNSAVTDRRYSRHDGRWSTLG